MDGSAEGVHPGTTDEPSNGDNGTTDDNGTWFTRIVNWLISIAEGITSLPTLIWEKLRNGFNGIISAVQGLPELILSGIKDIFIPDADYIESSFKVFTDELKTKFNFDTAFFEDIFKNEQAVEDVEGNYTIPGVGDFKLKFIDVSFFVKGVEYFRPFIRGFLVLLLALYNIKQLIGFFGYDAGVVTGRQEWVAYNKANTGGHKDE